MGKAISEQFISQGGAVVVGQLNESKIGDYCKVDLANAQYASHH